MKREIKFRAWNEGKMIDLLAITPLALDANMNTQLALRNMGGLFLPFGGNIELMQYTGLKDKNGKEIFESDVLNKKTTFEDNMADKRFQISTQINVGFEQGCFINKNDRRSLFNAMRTISSFGIKVWTDYEIIGNELENPELL